MVGIYKIESPTGRVYIGQSWKVEVRFKQYRNGHASRQPAIHNSFVKHGVDSHSFQVLHELPSDVEQQTLDQYEVVYWELYRECGVRLLNVREPGKGGRMSAESKKKMSAWQIGKKLSDETKKKISERLRGQPLPKERADKLRSVVSERFSNPIIRRNFDGTTTEYPSIRAAARATGIDRLAIARRLGQGEWSHKT